MSFDCSKVGCSLLNSMARFKVIVRVQAAYEVEVITFSPREAARIAKGLVAPPKQQWEKIVGSERCNPETDVVEVDPELQHVAEK